MSHKFKDIDIKNHTYYFFDDIIHIKSFDPNNIKTDNKPYKSILIYYIEYVTIKRFQTRTLYILLAFLLIAIKD